MLLVRKYTEEPKFILIPDNATWHTQNTRIFYPTLLTYEKLRGILFLIKMEIISGQTC